MTLLRFSNHLHLAMLAAATLFLGACANETLISNWTNPEYRPGTPMIKTAVIVLTKDENMRSFAESQMIQNLPKGTVAVAGHTMFKNPEEDKEVVRAKLIQDGFDSVLVSRLISVDKTQTYVPPQTYASPNYGYSNYYGGAYGGGGYYNTTTPGYTVENTLVVVETLLYRLPDAMLVWSGTSQSFNPMSKGDMVKGISQLIGDQMQRKHLLGTSGK
jgi:hypothetical protein